MYERRQYQLDDVDYAMDHGADLIPIHCAPTGCHASGTKVLMHDGSLVNVEDVVVGARLIGPDGTPRLVLNLCRGRGLMYRITPRRGGEAFVVNEEHVLSLWRTNETKANPTFGRITNLTVRDYLRRSDWFRHTHKLYRAGSVDFANEYRREDLPIDPWLLGVLLGDGSISQPRVVITSADPEIRQRVEATCGVVVRSLAKAEGICPSFSLVTIEVEKNPILDHLRHFGLIGKKSGTKFIPPAYCYADRQSRLELLAGLIDTDGHYSANAEYDLCMKSKKLIEQAAFVARSVGLTVSRVREKVVNGDSFWRISLNGDLTQVPVVTPRKIARARIINKNPRVSGFSLEPLGEGDYYGFTLDGDHLYLLSDFTVTHNSGKSLCQARIAKRELDRGNRTAILTPRAEIFGQTHGVLNEIVGLGNVAMLKSGEYWRRDMPVHIVSWPTLTSRTKRSEAWYPDVERLIVDEAHLAMAPKILECLEYYRARGTVIDGYTATPARKSGKGLGDFFTNIKHVTTVRQLLEDGKLCPPEYWWGKAADETGFRKTGGDFNSKDVSRANMPLIGDVVDNWCRVASDKHTMVFAADILHCEALTERFQQAGVSCASLHHKKTDERRAEIDAQFKARKIQVLLNVNVGSYGYDAPSVDCIVLARQTQSIVFHLQAIGRGMRAYPGKDFFMVIDHARNVKRLGKAEDLYRWRLDRGRQASANWTRDKRSSDAKKGADKLHDCENCQYIFSRSLVCPKCGWEVPLPKRDIAAIDADVVRMSGQMGETRVVDWPDDQSFFLQLRHHQEAKGYSFGWVLHNYKRKKMVKGRRRKNDPLPKEPPLPPKEWNYLPTIPPEPRVASWIRSRLIAYAKSRKRAAA